MLGTGMEDVFEGMKFISPVLVGAHIFVLIHDGVSNFLGIFPPYIQLMRLLQNIKSFLGVNAKSYLK